MAPSPYRRYPEKSIFKYFKELQMHLQGRQLRKWHCWYQITMMNDEYHGHPQQNIFIHHYINQFENCKISSDIIKKKFS